MSRLQRCAGGVIGCPMLLLGGCDSSVLSIIDASLALAFAIVEAVS